MSDLLTLAQDHAATPDDGDHDILHLASGGTNPVPKAGGTPRTAIDDTEHAAGAGTIARASLAPDIKVQMQRYAEAFKQPLSDFGVVGGHIVRKIPETGEYARVQPSVAGSSISHPLDTAERAMDWVASGAGPAIPAVTSAAGAAAAAILATPETAGAGTLPAAMAGSAAGGAAGETMRQKLDAALAPKGGEAPMDWGNVGWQGAAGAAGPVIGKGVELAAPGVSAGLDRIAPGLAKSAPNDLASFAPDAAADAAGQAAGEEAAPNVAKTLGLSPAGVSALESHVTAKKAELEQLEKDLSMFRDNGAPVDLSLGQKTGSVVLQQKERQMLRDPATAQQVSDLRDLQNETQIPDLVRKGVLDTVAPGAPKSEAVGPFRDAAETVIDKTFKDQSAKAAPAYAKALDDKPDFWSDGLTDIMKRPSMQAGWREAQKDAAEEGRALPDLFSQAPDGTMQLNEQNVSWRDWQNIKVGMRKAIEAETDDTTGKMTPDGRRLQNTLKDMMGVLYKANPDWRAADAAYGSASEVTDAVLEGGVGMLNKMTGADRQNMITRVLSGDNLVAGDVAAMRRQFAYAGKINEWNAAVRSHIEDKLSDAISSSIQTNNVGGKLFKSLFKNQDQADAIKAALGDNTVAVERWDALGRVLNAAKNQLAEGSASITDLQATPVLNRIALGIKMITNPQGIPGEALDKAVSAGNSTAAQKLAKFALTPEGDKLLRAMYLQTPASPKAQSLLAKMFTSAGVVAGEEAARGSDNN